MKRRSLVALIALLFAGTAFAAAPGGNAPGIPNSEAAAVVLATGPNSGVDGYLSIEVDEYGSWGDFGGVGLSDNFNPAGPDVGLPVAFTTGFFLFVPARGQRELLSTIPDWLAVYVDDATISASITSPNVAGDLNGDGVDDAAASSFSVTGGGTDLSVDVTQVLSSLGGGVAAIVQTYSITNNEGSAVSLELVRNFDGDLLFDGDFTSDEVGTGANNGGVGPYVYTQEVGETFTAVTVSGDASAYYGGKLGILPGGVPPAYGFGTDVQIYDTGALPGNWANHIAGIGYDTDGASGAAPAGCDVGTGCDAFIGLRYNVTIAAGATEEIVITHTYGSNVPGGGNAPLNLSISGTCPGMTTLSATGGTPNGKVGIVWSTSEGNSELGRGPCADSVSGLDNPRLFRIQDLDGSGSFSLTRNAPAPVCGRFIQLVDALADCALSNVSQVPQ